MSYAVRRAEPRDLPLLTEIELSADRMFAPLGIVFPAGPTVVEEVMADLGERVSIQVVGDPPIGFAAVVDVDGHPHLEQIALEASYTGRGIGGLLLEQVIKEAAGDLTLITFREVPWNGPWYARYGFAELPEPEWGPQLRDHWQAEIDAGLHALGPRLVMCHRNR